MIKHDEPDYRRVFLAVFLAAIVLIAWQVRVEWPRRQALAHLNVQTTEQHVAEQQRHAEEVPAKEAVEAEDNPALSRAQRLAASPRIAIDSDTLHGSIALKGARFDDLSLVKYRTDVDPQSPEVMLLTPNGDEQGYFVQAGWLASDNSTKVPDQHTLWQADKKELHPGETVTLRWQNGQGVTFVMAISLDENYMFDIAQRVENHADHDITLLPYAYINRTYELPKQAAFLHEGPLGIMEGSLSEVTYKELKEKGNKTYDNASGWFGITDKYWLSALIPAGEHHKVTFSHYVKNDRDRYQVDYLNEPFTIAAGSSTDYDVRLFAGAKELKVLDHYAAGTAAQPPIPLFDRALDFGYFYFLAKPTVVVTNILYHATGNFGIALLLFIILVKIVMFPLANKSYHSMTQMRKLQPEMLKLRERYAGDQIGMHKATRELYKREKINPAAGCLPVLIQIVVFLALFRGLNVTIEMRHAPFYGWIKDLSAPDPANLFTAFGALPWETPSMLHLGLLPILYCITMIIQTKQQPKPADPVQAKMMSWMPFFLLVFFDKMASGFVLYWTWSNILSIFQQRFITRKDENKKGQVLIAE